ncbi:hypothetical protein KIPE111705_42920 [Kibdelosporangium persicum]|nr:hypothetical protein [Kibdelosporangium persicum]
MTAVSIEFTPRPLDVDEIELVDDVEELGAFARYNCAASDDNPY